MADQMPPAQIAVAVTMLLGERHPDATVGLTMTRKLLTKVTFRAGDGAQLTAILPFHWPFASEDAPDDPINRLIMVTAGSLRAAILAGSPADGLINIEELEAIAACETCEGSGCQVPNCGGADGLHRQPDWVETPASDDDHKPCPPCAGSGLADPTLMRDHYDGRLLTEAGNAKTVGRLRRKALARFRERMRAYDGRPVRIEASFQLAGDAAEFVKLGVFGGDDEVLLTMHHGHHIGLIGQQAAVFWVS